MTLGSLGIKFLDLNSFKATLPTAVTHAVASLTAARIFGSSVYITKNKAMQLSFKHYIAHKFTTILRMGFKWLIKIVHTIELASSQVCFFIAYEDKHV